MKKSIVTIALTTALISTSAVVIAQPMASPLSGMHDTRPADVQGVGVVKAIDAANNTITLQHQAIAAIGWPAMTMSFKVASPELVKQVKVSEKVQFTLRPDGMAGTLTSITVQP